MSKTIEIQEPQPERSPPPAGLPVVVLQWDASEQRVLIQFDAAQFKTWDFILAVLEMARLQAKHAKAMALENAKMAMMERVAREAEVRDMTDRLMGRA